MVSGRVTTGTRLNWLSLDDGVKGTLERAGEWYSEASWFSHSDFSFREKTLLLVGDLGPLRKETLFHLGDYHKLFVSARFFCKILIWVVKSSNWYQKGVRPGIELSVVEFINYKDVHSKLSWSH